MKNIDEVLNQNSFQVQQLLRRSHVIGPVNMDSIQKGYEKHGENFMLKLLSIITPDESSFTDLITPRPAVITAPAVDSKTLATGQTWSFWDKLLNGISKTGETIGQFKTDAAGNVTDPTQTPEAVAQQAATTKTLYIVAASIVALIVLILIFKK